MTLALRRSSLSRLNGVTETFSPLLLQATEPSARVNVSVDPRIELLSIVQLLAGYVLLGQSGFASKVLLIHTGLQPGGKARTLRGTVLTVSLAK